MINDGTQMLASLLDCGKINELLSYLPAGFSVK